MRFKSDEQRKAVMSKYRLVSVHHPKMFEKEVYSVFFVEKGKPLLDKYTTLFHVKARGKEEAVNKALKELGDKK